jgi:recombination protein RecA
MVAAARAPRRAPKAQAKRERGEKTRGIRKDAVAEYRAAMAKGGVVEVLRLSDDDVLCHVRRYVSTQSLELDRAIGPPGIPCGRITEISGDEATGKSTLVDHILAQTQKEGGIAVLVDTEETRSLEYSRKIGVNVDELLILQPTVKSLESVITATEDTIEFWAKREPDRLLTIAWDSVAATPSIRELDGVIEKQEPGLAARVLRAAMRRLSTRIAQRDVALVLVNQHYTKIGKVFGDPFVTYGGSGIRYHATLRIRLERGERIKRADGTIIGFLGRARILKSKLGGSRYKAELAIIDGVGIDNVYSIHERFQKEGFIRAGGGWNTMTLEGMEEPLRWQRGHEGLVDLCTQDPALFERLVSVYQTLA